MTESGFTGAVRIPCGEVMLDGDLAIPAEAAGLVLFVHGSGSSRFSPRNQYVAGIIHQAGIGTLLFDLLTREEEAVDLQTRHLRFDIGLLAQRLIYASNWTTENPETAHLRIGYFGSSTGGAAAIVAAAEMRSKIGAIVSRGGRPDLAGESLTRVISPTLLIVGGLDDVVIELNQKAYQKLSCTKELKIVPGATHLFEEPGKLEAVARLASDWFFHFL